MIRNATKGHCWIIPITKPRLLNFKTNHLILIGMFIVMYSGEIFLYLCKDQSDPEMQQHAVLLWNAEKVNTQLFDFFGYLRYNELYF